MSHVTSIIPESVRVRWNEYRLALKEAQLERSGNAEEIEVAGWGVEEAEQRNKSEASEFFPVRLGS